MVASAMTINRARKTEMRLMMAMLIRSVVTMCFSL
jgi:hypothetical protein